MTAAEKRMWQLAREHMTRKQFQVFYLHVHEGISHRAIALALGIDRGTVRDRIRRGKKRLEDAIEHDQRKAA